METEMIMNISMHKWILAPLGKSAYDFLQLFFTYPSTGALKTILKNGVTNTNKFLQSVIGYTFIQQIIMTIAVALGLLCVILLLLMPFFIVMYRNRQISALEEPEGSGSVSPRLGWVIYEFLSVFLVVAVFGGMLMCLSTIEFEDKVPELFDFADFAVTKSYDFKVTIIDRFHYNLFDISLGSFDAIQLFYDVNDAVGEDFVSNMSSKISPIRFLAQSIQWNIKSIENSLTRSKDQLESLKASTDDEIKKLIEEYRITIANLKTVFDKENAKEVFGDIVDPLLNTPNYTSNITFEGFDDAIQRLKEASKLDFQTTLQNITQYLHSTIGYPNYDPSPIMEKLKQIVFDTEQHIQDVMNDYISVIDSAFSVKVRDNLLQTIKSYRTRTLETTFASYILFMVFSISSVVVGIFFFTAFTLGIWGTKGFRIQFPGVRGYKSRLSHFSGKFIVFLIYVTVVFLAGFWAVSIFLLVFSAIPIEMCLSSQDKSLLDSVIDLPMDFQRQAWYIMFSSRVFNSSLNISIIECEKDPTFFSLLPDDIVIPSHFNDIKNDFNASSINETLKNIVQNIPKIAINESALNTLNLEDVLNIDIHRYFGSMTETLQTLTSTNASSIFDRIVNHRHNSLILDNAALTALKSYESLVSKLSTAVTAEEAIKSLVKSTNVTLQMVVIEIDSFKIATEELVVFLKENSSDIYISILEANVFEMIDNVASTVDLAFHSFRKSISFCHLINFLYQRLLNILCELLLYPVSASWMGSFFVDLFLLFSVFLCLYSVPLFLIPSTVVTCEPPAIIRPEDIPTTSQERLGPHIPVGENVLSDDDEFPKDYEKIAPLLNSETNEIPLQSEKNSKLINNEMTMPLASPEVSNYSESDSITSTESGERGIAAEGTAEESEVSIEPEDAGETNDKSLVSMLRDSLESIAAQKRKKN